MKVDRITDYTMPKLAMAMNEGTIAHWLVTDGTFVKAGDPLATIETEKVAYDVESPHDGYFFASAKEGETLDCDTLIGWFCPTDQPPTLPKGEVEQSQRVAQQSTASGSEGSHRGAPTDKRIKISPLAKKLATQRELNLAQIHGTGPGGRIVKRDILAVGAAREKVLGETTLVSGESELARIPLSGVRGAIAQRTHESLLNSAQLTSNWESDITELLRVRADFVDRADALGSRVSVNAFLAKALVYAVRQVPIANAVIEDDAIVVRADINLGIAISQQGDTPYDTSLIVGVLRNIQNLGVVELDVAMRKLITRVRDGTATPEDVTGSTFTLSSTAGIGPAGLMSTPILNQPNVALLGPSTPIERPYVCEGEVSIRTMMPLSFTFDHRALDGEPAARFMSALDDALRHPHLMLA
jgi:pyruvate/2-oxoglutarate dehydrogenase complex dihydrolipoamide acyltransferase (E2) component